LATDLLDTLRKDHPALYERSRYCLVEISPTLQAVQQERLRPQHNEHVSWATSLEELPSGVSGAILGNEFIDAFPVHVLQNREGTLLEQFVDIAPEEGLKLIYAEPSNPRLKQLLARYEIELAPGEQVEINLESAAWFAHASRVLDRGVVTLIDYGDTQPSRYSQRRREGTLLAYYGGAVTDDVLAHPGEQDITALVDFTALKHEATDVGFLMLGMARQASFLVGLGLGTTVTTEGQSDELTSALNYRRGLQTLVSMEGLGRFHVLLLGKGLDPHGAGASLSGLKYAGLL
ncbi:MAG: hypothetical protein QOH93_3441, partial [Chloroflexia bacterium]|nr:hypothetical protein [Chloroflexia bacterium]